MFSRKVLNVKNYEFTPGYIFTISLAMLLGGVIVVLKKGFAEVIKGLESIDEKLRK